MGVILIMAGCLGGGGDGDQETSPGEQTAETYSISGTVTSAEHMVTDSDVNDPNATYATNNSFAAAQEISAPVTVSGFVNVDNTGSLLNGDRFARDGDDNDYYLLKLTSGMNITLYMTENPRWAALNLYLYDESGNLMDASLLSGRVVDSLTVPADGIYYVRVEAVSDTFTQTITTYALTMGLPQTTADQYPIRLGSDFVPEEMLVRCQGSEERWVSTSGDPAADLSAIGFHTKSGGTGRDRLVQRSHLVDKDTFFENLGIRSALERSIRPGNMAPETRRKMETLWMIRALRNQAGIEIAEPNYIRKPFSTTPDDPYYAYQWHYPLINLPEAWDVTTGSNDVVVAVVDTGVLLDHPDLAGRLLDGYDFISSTDISLDGDGIDDDPDDPGDQEGFDGGSSFHGTHVTGTIAALTNNTGDGEEGGVASIAWNALVMPLRALGHGGGTTYDIMEAVKYAAGLENISGTTLDQPVDIINMSLGGENATEYERGIYAEARAQGVIIIAAAGNDGSDVNMYPAAYDGVVSVSAVTINETLAAYSNHGDTIDVAAPGGSATDANGDGYVDGILSTTGDDSDGSIKMGYAFSMGTSMATPHVSGVVALMKSLYTDLTPDMFDALLAAGYLTRDIGDTGRDDSFGHGLIDAYQAVLIAQEGGSGDIPAIVSVSPANLNFIVSSESPTQSSTVTVNNTGSEDPTLTDVYSNVSWMWIQASDVDAYGLGTYTVNVERGDLSEGTYTGTVAFESEKNTAEISVVLQVAGTGSATDGGYHYILLLDSQTLATVDQVSSAGEDGVYGYRFSGLSYGNKYVVYAGTDADHDGFICDDAEACGACITLDDPVEITVTADMEHRNFTTDMAISLPTTITSQFTTGQTPIQLKTLKEGQNDHK